MNTGMQIIKPQQITQISTNNGTGVENLKEPSPREVWQAAIATTSHFDIDLGSPVEVDGFFLGSTNAAADTDWEIFTAAGFETAPFTRQSPTDPIRIDDVGPVYHGYHRLAAPVTSQYFRIVAIQPGANDPLFIGNLVVGLVFEHAYQYRSGRRPIDLSQVTELRDGGYGIDFGAIKSSYNFTFSDLSEDEAVDLENRLMEVGNSGPVVLVEGHDTLRQRQVHYGLFQRFEAFSREDPKDTKWALSMVDWV